MSRLFESFDFLDRSWTIAHWRTHRCAQFSCVLGLFVLGMITSMFLNMFFIGVANVLLWTFLLFRYARLWAARPLNRIPRLLSGGRQHQDGAFL